MKAAGAAICLTLRLNRGITQNKSQKLAGTEKIRIVGAGLSRPKDRRGPPCLPWVRRINFWNLIWFPFWILAT